MVWTFLCMIWVRFPCYQPEMKLQKAPFLRYVGIQIIHVQYSISSHRSMYGVVGLVFVSWELGEFCHTGWNPSSFVAGNLQSESEGPATGILLYTHINFRDGRLTNTLMSQPTMFQPQVHPVNLAQEEGRVQVAFFRNGGFFRHGGRLRKSTGWTWFTPHPSGLVVSSRGTLDETRIDMNR